MRFLLTVLLMAVVLFPLTVAATDVEGDVWGTWTRENSPYNVIGEIRVPPGSTLVIQPGILVDFKGHYMFIVDSLATLLAVGTETDSIFFTTEDTATGWRGLCFFYSDSGSQIVYCRLQYANENAAIRCLTSSPTIANNTISDNSSGGIWCERSGAIIIDNVISGNSAGWGGGISSNDGSNGIIAGNLITANSARYGGGIYCGSGSGPVIRENIITGNWGDQGGGITCWGGIPYMLHNIVSCNSIVGVNCILAGVSLTNCTISRNAGGGICCIGDYCYLGMQNSIVWGNSGYGIWMFEGTIADVAYCDVQGGYSGQGNMNADPLFAGRETEDYCLRWHSPCIDAGVPDSLDPDGTRSDIGAFYFDQSAPGIVELYPHETPIVIPRQGGELSFDGWLFNFSGQTGRVDIWTYLFAPEIGRYGPLDLFKVRIPADSLGLTEISRRVPEVAPEGDYVFVAYVGQYPSSIVDSSYFYFSKEGEVVGVPGDWTEENLPLDYSLLQNYPNPFNATTRINYQLPVDAHVRLEVYNVLGQKVATFVDGKQQPGYKSVVWDASEVSSGFYFYKLTAGDFTETKRMMLVR